MLIGGPGGDAAYGGGGRDACEAETRRTASSGASHLLTPSPEEDPCAHHSPSRAWLCWSPDCRWPVLDSASAAPAECQGRTATIVSDGGTVTGTEGDDVISTAGAVNISALGGDDIICVTLGSGDVDGGAGSDTLVLLGPDTDAEGWAVDLAGTVRRAATTVVTFAGLESYTLDFGRPVEVEVQGTDGDDAIELVGGQYDAKLGAGRDLFVVGGYEFSGRIDGGDGTDAHLGPRRQPGSIIDLGRKWPGGHGR